MRRLTIVSLVITTLLLAAPSYAYAWGFGVHLLLGNQLLGQLSSLPVHLQQLLSAFPADFLYGCISADITLGKKYTHYLKHCHSWNIGDQLLQKADSDAQQACAYGYIAHLAADTIAHDYMVPFQMVRSYNSVFLNHAYWELRFESHISDHIWREARLLARQDFTQHDALLRRVLANTIFSFDTNKQLFNSMLLISRIKRWRKLLTLVDSRSHWEVGETARQEYLSLAADAITSVLSDPNSPYRNADPSGERALHVAHLLRNNLKTLWVEGKLPQAQSSKLITDLKGEFRRAITEPKLLLDMVADEA
ncbi:MAG: zinc dependent phospholipase C family protein [Desulfuromonas sp.]|nr:zinc dependent phospholipase C family protein [Desulfuromonas sp.]